MCDWKPGDEIECVASRRDYVIAGLTRPTVGATYTIREVVPCFWAGEPGKECVGLYLVELPEGNSQWSYAPRDFRKVERRNDRLSIEAFLTIKPGFEEPRRAPAKKRERAS